MLEANDVASVVLARSGTWMDAMRLQKLLYYVQAWHLAVTDEPLFAEQIKAWKDGPVVPQVWHERKDQATRSADVQSVEDIELDETTSNLIDLVLASYGSMSGEELSALTHVEQPWLEARGDLPENAECRDPISAETMARFYRANRKLGGRTASDLAAAGIYVRAHRTDGGPIDVDSLLAAIPEDDDLGDDCWGGASLDPGDQYRSAGIVADRRRAYAEQ
ncbi:DUF4065 domain-containing protein [Amycolatopsis sp. NBC_01307]|uniref:Panacea domain-containing protein n=1 Tax=Amycolatopsis sp. NBC_01307 TaxID=2903561 RepID=UPI002E10368A|nr:DUF4065 domain-containing protein [Amycolatopsis sp. NBC_01307]